MKNYVLSSLKYLLRMTLLMVAIYGVMYFTGTLGITTDELLGTKGIVLAVALVAISIAYPSYGFVHRTVKASMVADREEILAAFHQNGYSLCKESEVEMVFHASAPLKRVWHLGDDRIVVRPIDGFNIDLYGIRKEVVQTEFRITSYLIGKGQQ